MGEQSCLSHSSWARPPDEAAGAYFAPSPPPWQGARGGDHCTREWPPFPLAIFCPVPASQAIGGQIHAKVGDAVVRAPSELTPCSFRAWGRMSRFPLAGGGLTDGCFQVGRTGLWSGIWRIAFCRRVGRVPPPPIGVRVLMRGRRRSVGDGKQMTVRRQEESGGSKTIQWWTEGESTLGRRGGFHGGSVGCLGLGVSSPPPIRDAKQCPIHRRLFV